MLETLNNGKPITDAVTHDIPGAIGMFEYFAGTTFHSYGQIHDFPDATALVHREPIGPVAQIIPWNVPLLMASFKMAPALAAGCTVVLKPAEVAFRSEEHTSELQSLMRTPYTGFRLTKKNPNKPT